jgi:predicted ribosome quality control (RQC) complex YloA/Tae2 family protein
MRKIVIFAVIAFVSQIFCANVFGQVIEGDSIKMKGKLFINSVPGNVSDEIKNKFSAFIAGGVLSEDYAIAPKSDWKDYVFNADYQLLNLNEVENYIKENKHLPDIPSAAEVQKNGYTLHEMNVKLLQKVEELTLYAIEQNKEIERLKKLENSYQTLMEKLEELENKIKQ